MYIYIYVCVYVYIYITCTLFLTDRSISLVCLSPLCRGTVGCPGKILKKPWPMVCC